MVQRRNRAVVLVVVSVILIGLGALLFTVDVGKVSQYAGVGSFLVGLLTASMSAALFVRTVRSPTAGGEPSHDQHAPAEGARRQHRPKGSGHVDVHGTVKILSTGKKAKNSNTEYNFNIDPTAD